MRKILKGFVSPLDKLLRKFNATHDKSASQMAEIKKHDRIQMMRDQAVDQPSATSSSNLWDKF